MSPPLSAGTHSPHTHLEPTAAYASADAASSSGAHTHAELLRLPSISRRCDGPRVVVVVGASVDVMIGASLVVVVVVVVVGASVFVAVLVGAFVVVVVVVVFAAVVSLSDTFLTAVKLVDCCASDVSVSSGLMGFSFPLFADSVTPLGGCSGLVVICPTAVTGAPSCVCGAL
ncbi:hypothetical protein TcCL_ESM10771 [Trypanosoma cruzi]|nr:hypothetical protein TcCL_ESM10771 [Trypanosoma cruzi]